ncbi:hypothetical protein [Salinispira pacifica]|uniref:hypothetical protein n=1 Tax=Salinispira pacifica TaxID=1307761 RepID=UPI001181FFFA|nr:hypothetical protein [Salinispira pacifica]
MLMLVSSGLLTAQNTITVRFRSAQQNTTLRKTVRYFTFNFNADGRLVECRIEEQREDQPRNLRRHETFQDQDDHILYTREDFSQGELTKKERRIILSKEDGYSVIRSADPGGTPDLFFNRRGEDDFIKIYKNMEISSIEFTTDELAVHHIYHDAPSILHHYNNERLDYGMHGEQLFYEAEYTEEYIHVTYPTPDMGDGNIYVYIGDDYVPPADDMIRAFNAFLMPGEYRGYLLPFVVGYF